MNATIKKRISWKNRSKVFEKALETMDTQFARTKGLLGTMIFLFGQDVMEAVRVFHDNPTPENHDKLTVILNDYLAGKVKEAEASSE